jgi:nucleoside 2-deoxyribosyltransferase
MNSRKRTRTVYLCGPIMDCSPEESGVWRERAKTLFSDRFITLDPMRRNFKDCEVDSANEIVSFDLQDIAECDIVLVNYCKPSVGSAMEVFHASYNLDKFVIAFSPFPFKECNPWMIRFCTKILPGLDSAIQYIEEHF